jgi:23S rRNA (adenine2030-N6)-methyltransferase
MNYRHFYHAGNFADVFKHLVMVLAMDHLQQKEKGLFCLDAFAGCGLYDLAREEAQRTQEYENGIGRIMSVASLNPDLRRYQSLIAPYWARRTYPGSPLLLAELLRPQDRLIANELHPEDHESLELSLGRFSNIRTPRMDAYESIRATIPPPERRGMVLIDPPFEKKNEFELLVRQMGEWKKRWPTGCYIIWYPIKAHLPVFEFHDVAAEFGFNRTWVADFLLHDRDQQDTFNGSGLLILNTPFQLPEKIAALSPELCALLKGRMEMNYLTDE